MPRKLHPYIEGKVRGMKYCPDCGEERPVTEFSPNPSRADGYATYCRKHNCERHRKWREANPERFRTYHRNYQAKRREQRRLLAPAPYPCERCPRCKYPLYHGKCLHCYQERRRAGQTFAPVAAQTGD